jgi:hypothetical protein
MTFGICLLNLLTNNKVTAKTHRGDFLLQSKPTINHYLLRYN